MTSRSAQIIVLAVTLALAVTTSCQSKPQTRWKIKPEVLAQMESEWELRVRPNKQVYYRGERVFLRTWLLQKTGTHSARQFPKWQMGSSLPVVLFRDGQDFRDHVWQFRTTAMGVGATDSTWLTETGGIEELWTSSRGFDTTERLREQVVVGVYRGVLDAVIISNWFSFRVVEPSKELKDIENRFIDIENHEGNGPATVDSLLDAMEWFIALDSAQAYRCDGIGKCMTLLTYLGTIKNFGRNLTTEDSTRMVAGLVNYCETCPLHSHRSDEVYSALVKLFTMREYLGGRFHHSLGAYCLEIGSPQVLASYLRVIDMGTLHDWKN